MPQKNIRQIYDATSQHQTLFSQPLTGQVDKILEQPEGKVPISGKGFNQKTNEA